MKVCVILTSAASARIRALAARGGIEATARELPGGLVEVSIEPDALADLDQRRSPGESYSDVLLRTQ